MSIAVQEFHGTTPCLLLDLDDVEQHLADFSRSMPGLTVHYAMKCNPAPELLACLHAHGCSFEIASQAELATLSSIGVDPKTVLFSNPVKRADDVELAARHGVWRFAVDGVEELEKIAKFAPESAVYIRMSTGVRASKVSSEGKFGVDPQEAVGLLLCARQLGLRPHGLTFHVGSQMVNPQAWLGPIAQCGDIMRSLMAYGIRLSMIDIGGGFPVPYDTPVPTFAEFGRVITGAIDQLPYCVEITAEPGRALVAESGLLIATVIGTARRFGHKWVHLDVGAFNGMMESLETHNTLRFPVRDSLGSTETENCHLTGPSCDGQDTILYDVPLSRGLSCGDRVFIGNTGSYTTSYASTFNGFSIPTTICFQN
jgi:ornithine decarboxylase